MIKQVLFSLNEVQKWFQENEHSILALDTETTSLRYSHLSIEGISLCNGSSAIYIDLLDNQRHEIIDYLRVMLPRCRGIIGHNLVYDLKVLSKYNINLRKCKLFCTMVADHLIDENRRHGLKELAETLLGQDVTHWEDIPDHHCKKFYEYAINDAMWTWQLHEIYKPLLKEQGLFELFTTIEMPFQWCLVEMEINGVLVDKEEVLRTTKEIKVQLQNIEMEMLECLHVRYQKELLLDGGTRIISPINFNSSQQLIDILFNKLGLTVIETTPSGAPSVGSETITKLKGQHPFIAILERYKIAQKLLSAFFEPLPEHIYPDGRVRPSFRDTGTKTGRLSCSDPNLQQLPKVNEAFPIDTRKCFIAPKGYTFVTCDYSSQELRVLAHLTQESALLDSFEKGKDLHLSTANDMFDLKIPEEALYETGKEYKTYKSKFKKERNDAKTINFGIAYGKGAFGFSKDFNISEEEAQEILDRYFGSYPKVLESIQQCRRNIDTDGFVSTLTGRRRRFDKITKETWTGYSNGSKRQAFNFLIQGYSADMIRIAAIKCLELSDSNPDWDLKLIGTVHDEILFNVKEQYEEVACNGIHDCFTNAVQLSVPLKSEIGKGKNYSDAK